MSDFTSRMAAKALELLEKRGAPCVLSRRVRGQMTASGDRADAPADSPAMGVEFPGTDTVEFEGVTRPKGIVLMSAVDPAPAVGDVVTINGNERVVAVPRNMAPDGVLIYSRLEVAL